MGTCSQYGLMMGKLQMDIMRVTKDFDIRYCIGTRGYGSVYKAHLPSGKIVALKKLHHLEAEDLTFDKSFQERGQNVNRNPTSEHCETPWLLFA